MTSPLYLQQSQKGTKEEKELAEKSVLLWADETFHSYDSPRFENFVAHYTEEYQMMSMRVEMLEKRREKVDSVKEKENYENLGAEIEKAKKRVADIEQRVTHYEVDFWANIATTDGITVNYRHKIILDNNFKVVSHEETAAIGKKDQNTKIRYKNK